VGGLHFHHNSDDHQRKQLKSRSDVGFRHKLATFDNSTNNISTKNEVFIILLCRSVGERPFFGGKPPTGKAAARGSK